MSKIQVLDQITIDKISRWRSHRKACFHCKELVENAIDAGASLVTIESKTRDSLYVSQIMEAEIERADVRNAFLRHSTSKIQNVEDLAHISSLGFRGEALSSIAAVTQTELITKTKEEMNGTRYVIEGGQESCWRYR